MEPINPETLRLIPGQSMQGVFVARPSDSREVGFFVRSAIGETKAEGDLTIRLRAGLVKFNDVMLVLTMIRVNGDQHDELFDIWWNYYSPGMAENFKRICEQEIVTVHFYTEGGRGFSVSAENEFRKFFKNLPQLISKSPSWTEIEFDRAVRGFCAQSYPKENLWDLIELRPASAQTSQSDQGIESYSGSIPSELQKFYFYFSDSGHCIKVIPSFFEQEATLGNPDDYLYPVPVKTVLRCGLRWIKGYPVAPVPFIPEHGMAFPPDDIEK